MFLNLNNKLLKKLGFVVLLDKVYIRVGVKLINLFDLFLEENNIIFTKLNGYLILQKNIKYLKYYLLGLKSEELMNLKSTLLVKSKRDLEEKKIFNFCTKTLLIRYINKIQKKKIKTNLFFFSKLINKNESNLISHKVRANKFFHKMKRPWTVGYKKWVVTSTIFNFPKKYKYFIDYLKKFFGHDIYK